MKSTFFGIGEAGKVSESTPLDDIEAERLQPTRVSRFALCDCGHYVPAGQVLSASFGTACGDCYDKMSDMN